MSTTKTTKTADDRVEVNIPRGGDREDPNLFVAVNGVNYLLPRGKKSRVPKAVADEIARAERARERLQAYEKVRCHGEQHREQSAHDHQHLSLIHISEPTRH